MSNRPCNARRSITRAPQSNRARSSESNRRGNQRTNNNMDVIEERDEPQMNEERECESMEIEPRYDPKEMRGVVKILSFFVRLIEDTKNPYARIVAREVCKTFYRLFHPNIHPADVIKSIHWRSKSLRSHQLWEEFWLYVPGGKINNWIPLVKSPEDSTINNTIGQPIMTSSPKNVNYNSCQLNPRSQPIPPKDQTPLIPLLEDLEEDLDRSYHDNSYNNNDISNIEPPSFNFPDDSPGSSEFLENTNHHMYPTMDGNISPSEMICDHQAAGSDSSQYVSSNYLNNKDHNKYTSEFIATQTSDNMHQQKQFAEYVNKKCFVIFDNTTRENQLLHNDSHKISPKRQTAGNDHVYMPYCEPGPSSDPPHYTDNPSQFEYYRITGNSTTPPPPRPNQESQVEPVINNEECNDTDSVESVKELDINQIACNASIVANAFTNLSLASNELKKKKEAFKKLTHSYLNVAPNSSELNPSGENNSGAKMVLQTLYENPPKISPFDDHEWNDSAFKDRDFIRLLPFYEHVHNELEYISKEQRSYGYNMLDDIMSTLYHIHYDLGDPRLKNDMLVDHVKLITANTWESYFYKGNKRMPPIPERIPTCLRQPSPRESLPREPCPREPCPREPCPREPCPREPIPRSPCPRLPEQREPCPREPSREPQPSGPRRPPVSRRAVPSRETAPSASATTSNRPQPRTTSSRRMPDTQQQNENPPPESQTRTFLRRSRPSGAPKAWAPKLKPIERPENFQEFRAKPLPRFFRDRRGDGQC